MNTVTYKIPNISCGHCVKTIEMEIGDLDGVLNVSAAEDTRQVEIEFQDPANEQQIKDVLEEINYPVAAS